MFSQTDKAALEAQLAGAMQEVASAQTESKAAREEATGVAQQLEAAEQSKVGLLPATQRLFPLMADILLE